MSAYKKLIEDVTHITGGLTEEDLGQINSYVIALREDDEDELDAAIAGMDEDVYEALMMAQTPPEVQEPVRTPTTKTKRQPKRASAAGKTPAPAPERASKTKKVKGKKANVLRTGAPCPWCGAAIPALGEPGYHQRRKYCPDGVCAQERKSEVEAKSQSYLDARKEFLETKGTKAKVSERLPLSERPKGVKLDSKGFPKLCCMCGAFVPDTVAFVATCGSECHRRRKAGEPKLDPQLIRQARAQVVPVQIHPQGSGAPDSRPERKTKGKGARKRGKSPCDSHRVPVQESGEMTSTKTVAGKKASTVAGAEAILARRLANGELSKAMYDAAVAYLHKA